MNADMKAMLLASLRQTGLCDLTVGGQSMWPFIRHGEKVRIRRIDRMPAIGSVAAFFNDSQLILHRVVWTARRGDFSGAVWLWGDSSPHSLAKVGGTEIAGLVIGTLGGQHLHRFWFTTPARLLCLPIGALLHLLVHLRQSVRSRTPQAP
jgi:hypothetical protein